MYNFKITGPFQQKKRMLLYFTYHFALILYFYQIYRIKNSYSYVHLDYLHIIPIIHK